jgi:hypothetical protein
MTTAVEPRGELKTTSSAKKLSFFHMRNWLGMPAGVWWPMLARNRFAVSPGRSLQLLRMSLFTPFNSVLHGLDRAIYGRRVARTTVAPPLFIIGHWRTGTTLLHELMVLDEQFSYPTTYQVMVPHHFLLTSAVLPRLLRHALPPSRPMDNMPVGFDRPQEDEFALCNLGVPSPYAKWAFPNRECPPQWLDLDELPPAQLERWSKTMVHFVRRLNFRDPRRVVMKSPTHTARVGHLARAFPGAQFVHIVRDPRDVFPSTVHTWKQLWDSLGFHAPTFAGIEEYVLECHQRMYRSFDREREQLGDKQLYELRYEDLIRDVVGEVGKVYDRLGLPGFVKARPKLEEYAAKSREYKTNRHQLPEETWQKIAQRWRGYIERYGYT